MDSLSRLSMGGFNIIFQRHDAVALFKAHSGGGLGVGAGDKSIPAYKIALTRDETLARAQGAFQPFQIGAVDDADRRKAAMQLRRRANELRKRRGIRRQRVSESAVAMR